MTITAESITRNARQTSNDNASDPFDDDPIRLGETKEIGGLRIHRFANCVTVTDTTNAGRRGTKCLELSIGSRDGFSHDVDSGPSSEVNLYAMRGMSIDEIAARMAEYYTVARREHRGVDVDPVGSKIEALNQWMIATFEPGHFSVRDFSDPNELTLFGKGKEAKQAHAWARANCAALPSMRPEAVRQALRNAGILANSYCGLD